MESLIYVIVYMAFRFHRHSLTTPDWKDLDTHDKQIQANARNERLAKTVYNFFYEDYITHGGLFVGGKQKMFYTMCARPPLQFTPGPSGPTILGEFLSRAYELLHQHSLTINQDALDRYAVKPPAADLATTGSPGPSAGGKTGLYMDISPTHSFSIT